MCYTIPGKVIEVKKDKAKVQYGDEIREVDASLVEVSEGDYVIVQAQFIMQTVPEKEALEVLDLWEKSAQSTCS